MAKKLLQKVYVIAFLVKARVCPVVVGDPRRGDVDARIVVLGVGDRRHVRAVRREVEEPVLSRMTPQVVDLGRVVPELIRKSVKNSHENGL